MSHKKTLHTQECRETFHKKNTTPQTLEEEKKKTKPKPGCKIHILKYIELITFVRI